MDSHQQGLQHFANGDYEAASCALSEALAEQETSERWNDWATVQAARQQFDKAERGYRRALQLDPQSSEAAMNLVTLLGCVGRPQDAIPFLELGASDLDEGARAAISALVKQFGNQAQSDATSPAAGTPDNGPASADTAS